MKKLMKKYSETGLGITKASVVMGVGASAVHQAGGNAGGINAMANMMPTVGSVAGGGMAIQSLKMLDSKKKKKY